MVFPSIWNSLVRSIHKSVSYNNPKAYPDMGESPVDDHGNLAKESWHPDNESANYVETNTDMRCIRGAITQVEQLVDSDMKADIPADDHEHFTDKSWPPLNPN